MFIWFSNVGVHNVCIPNYGVSPVGSVAMVMGMVMVLLVMMMVVTMVVAVKMMVGSGGNGD